MDLLKAFFFTAAWAFFVPAALHARTAPGSDELTKAQKYYDAKDYSNALKLLKVSFEKGCYRASINLGFFYQAGLGVPKDLREAARWYRIGAAHGYKDAEFDLAVLYEKGDGVPQDHKMAFDLFKKAAEQGDASADVQIGSYYEYGIGVGKNIDEAIKWYIKGTKDRSAADDFDLQMIYTTIASLYEKNGSEQDYREAKKWYQKASKLQIQEAEKITDHPSK